MFYVCVFMYLIHIFRSRISESFGNKMFNIWRNTIFFKAVAPFKNHTCNLSVHIFHMLTHFSICLLFIMAILMSVKWFFIELLTFNFLLQMTLSNLGLFLFWVISPQIFYTFLNWVIFSHSWYIRVLSILLIEALYKIDILQIFSPFCGLSFIFKMVLFAPWKF